MINKPYTNIIYDERQKATIFEIIDHIADIVKNDKPNYIDTMDGAQKVKELETFKQALQAMEHSEKVKFDPAGFKIRARKPEKIEKAYKEYKETFYYNALGVDKAQTNRALSIILSVTGNPRGASIKYCFDTIAGYYEQLQSNLKEVI